MLTNLFPSVKGIAQKVAKSLEKEKEYSVLDIKKVISDIKEPYQPPQNMLLITKELKSLGFKVNESNYVQTFESFTNDQDI